ncbi:di-heme oxidoredictase family protein [Devosia sp.]|uniref:di-heme oxidoreductase family protein n=1 Tax=Devosia sp. TaxID=1871048 RepID=UPI00326464C7
MLNQHKQDAMHIRLTILLAAVLATGLAVAQDGVPATRTDLIPKDLLRVQKVTAPTTDFSKPEQFENLSAGAGTTRKPVNGNVFSHFQANLSFEQQADFSIGDSLFRKLWVSAPSSTQASDGLGPLFNSRACQSCHIKDGRGHVPGPGEAGESLFLRLSVPPGANDTRESVNGIFADEVGDPTYGGQLQNFAVAGLPGEGRMVIDYTDLPVTLGDGTVVHLRSPHYSVADLGFGPMAPDVMMSPRIAPQMIGLGLVEQIPAEDILANADPKDANGDGISGKPNYTVDPVSHSVMLGRFGWKAGKATVRSQSAGAFAGDIGIATPLVNKPYGDCTPNEAACLALPNGVQERLGVGEAPDPVLDLVTFYSQTVGVPERRNIGDPAVLRGKEAFYTLGCTACHTPKFVTSRKAENPAQKFQLIWPYSDFLLHDMGDGLADYRPEGLADGYEWRTPPLWGTGLTQTVSGKTELLHDGRARDVTEAILWHGGEGQKSRDAFANLPKSARDDLTAFLESL